MIPKIVLTGGPCGGKTSTIEYLKGFLPSLGITPIICPEMATFVHNTGINLPDMYVSPSRGFRFNVQMILSQIQHEDMIESFAYLTPGLNKVVICDRGTIDNMAYTDDEMHEDILSQVGTLGYLKRRYDMIIHLDTLAFGDGYNLNNPARHENKDAARRIDERIFEMWAKGPHVTHRRIPHSVSLHEKMNSSAREIQSFFQ